MTHETLSKHSWSSRAKSPTASLRWHSLWTFDRSDELDLEMSILKSCHVSSTLNFVLRSQGGSTSRYFLFHIQSRTWNSNRLTIDHTQELQIESDVCIMLSEATTSHMLVHGSFGLSGTNSSLRVKEFASKRSLEHSFFLHEDLKVCVNFTDFQTNHIVMMWLLEYN